MRLFKTYSEKEVKRVRPLVNKINGLEEEISKLSDSELRGKTEYFKKQLKKYSVSALEELFELMANSVNQDIRYKCATYILDRCYGKDFVAERLEEQNKDIRIQLITRQGTEVDQSLIDKEEQELWNEAIEEDTDDWGTDDIYLG